MSQIRVYCGSSPKPRTEYGRAANLFAKVLISSARPYLAVCVPLLAVGCAGVQQPLKRTDSQCTVSFESPSGVPILACSVNGNEPAPFVLDTGAAYIVVNRPYAKRVGVVSNAPERKSVQGYRMQSAVLEELRIGAMVIENVEVELLDFRELGKRANPGWAGLLGYPFLKKFELAVDFSAATVTFRPNARRRLPRRFLQAHGLVIIPVLVEGQGPFNFILDTGAGGIPRGSHVDPHVLEALNLSPPKRREVQVTVPQGPSGRGRVWTTPYQQKRRAYMLEHYGVSVDGVIGWGLLHNWVVTINYLTETFSLKKYKGPPLPRPRIASVSPDISREIPSDTRQIVIEFSVPMMTTFSVSANFRTRLTRWLDPTHLVLVLEGALEPGQTYTITVGQAAMMSTRFVPFQEQTMSFKAAEHQVNKRS